jgi:hypothetical protein
VSLPLLGQYDAHTIFNRAIDQLLTVNMELSMVVEETDTKGRTREKNFDILMARFGDIEKTKMTMQKPDRAKGVTIVFTHLPGDEGLIEVFTPANGKTRKMKATPQNMDRVGSNFSLSNFAYNTEDDLDIQLLGRQEVNEMSCYQLEIREKTGESGIKSVFMVEENTYYIVQILLYDAVGNASMITSLSDYQPISGLKNKIQPMLIVSEDLAGNKSTRMQVLKITPRPDLKEEDFTIPESSN